MSFIRMSMAIVFVFSVGLVITSEAEPNYLDHICSNNTTFTPNSAYQSNRNNLLSSLSSNSTNKDGFHNTTTGQAADNVHGPFLCRGDLFTDVCQDCVTYGTQEVIRRCPVEKVAVIWYDECLLHYSNQSSFNNLTKWSRTWYSTQNGINRTSYRELVLATMNDLASQAASRAKKFATMETNFRSSFSSLYTLAQCTQDLSESNCQTCLESAIKQLAIEYAGGRTMTPSCTVRFEAYPFYNQSADPALVFPSPAPSPLLPPPSPLTLPPPPTGKGNFCTHFLKFISLFSVKESLYPSITTTIFLKFLCLVLTNPIELLSSNTVI